MGNIENCLSENLSKVLVKRNADFFSQKNEILVDEILFIFEKYELHVLPVIDTDEISISCSEYEGIKNLEKFEETSVFSKFLEKKLGVTWNCVNTKGYFDMFILSFHLLHPSLIIVSEGSVLKLFEVNMLLSE